MENFADGLINQYKTLSLSIISKSGGLKESAVAGKPSVTKLTQRSWTGIRASGTPNAAAKKMETTSPILELCKIRAHIFVYKYCYLIK